VGLINNKAMHKYVQSRDVSWLKTPKGTIWVWTGINSFLQPEDPALRTTPFGVNLDILDVEDFLLFQSISDKKHGSNIS